MNEPVVEPGRVLSDTRLLWPDVHRPGLPLRLPDDPEVAAASSEPYALCERIESGLAGLAWRYRRLMVCGAAAIVVPAGWWMLSWWAMWNVPDGWLLVPFTRGVYFPGPSFFEVSAAVLLCLIIGWGMASTSTNWVILRRLGTDYRRLLAAPEPARREIVAEATSGRWPRVEGLLRLGRGYDAFRVHLDGSDSQ